MVRYSWTVRESIFNPSFTLFLSLNLFIGKAASLLQSFFHSNQGKAERTLKPFPDWNSITTEPSSLESQSSLFLLSLSLTLFLLFLLSPSPRLPELLNRNPYSLPDLHLWLIDRGKTIDSLFMRVQTQLKILSSLLPLLFMNELAALLKDSTILSVSDTPCSLLSPIDEGTVNKDWSKIGFHSCPSPSRSRSWTQL